VTPRVRAALEALVASGALPREVASFRMGVNGLWLLEPADLEDQSPGWVSPWRGAAGSPAPYFDGAAGWGRLRIRNMLLDRDPRWWFQAPCGGEHGAEVCGDCGYRPEPYERGSVNDPVREFPPNLRVLVETVELGPGVLGALTTRAGDLVSWMRGRGCGVSYGGQLRVLWWPSYARDTFVASEAPEAWEDYPQWRSFGDMGVELLGVAQGLDHVTVALKLPGLRW